MANPGDLTVETIASAISRGTESLVFKGEIPEAEAQRMRCPNQVGDFPYPVKYGYALVGRVVAGPAEAIGRTVFALHPHQSAVALPASQLFDVPASVPPMRATLGANMETALNVVWDSGAGPCDRALVVGCGVVGLLVARLLAQIPGTEVMAVDTDVTKAAVARAMGARFATPDAVPGGFDVAINASGTDAGLATALAAAGKEARVVEASWHGARTAQLPLGGAFHSQRLAIVSSQVGSLPPHRAPRWTHGRRLHAALGLLDDPALDALITHNVPFHEAPARLPALMREPGPLAVVLTYRPEQTP